MFCGLFIISIITLPNVKMRNAVNITAIKIVSDFSLKRVFKKNLSQLNISDHYFPPNQVPFDSQNSIENK